MSIDYCEKHDRHFDTDYELDGCVLCQEEYMDLREQEKRKERIAFAQEWREESPDF